MMNQKEIPDICTSPFVFPYSCFKYAIICDPGKGAHMQAVERMFSPKWGSKIMSG
jgi:hypothetical protein